MSGGRARAHAFATAPVSTTSLLTEGAVRYEAVASAADHLAALGDLLAAEDRATEAIARAKARGGQVMVAAFVVGLAAVLCFIVGAQGVGGASAVGGVLIVLLTIGLAAWATLGSARVHVDHLLPHRRLHALTFTLDLLAPELASGADVRVVFDGRSTLRGGRSTSATERRPGKTLERWQRRQDGWLQLGAKVRGGGRVQVKVSSDVRGKTKTKHRRRGTRVSTHSVLTETVEIALTVPPGRALRDGAADAVLEPVMMLPLPIPDVRAAERRLVFRYKLGPAHSHVSSGALGKGADKLLDGHKLVSLLMASHRGLMRYGLAAPEGAEGQTRG